MVSITRISSKGQVVIPQAIRQKMKLEEGNIFLVLNDNDSIKLKKLEPPRIKTWEEATKPFREAAKKSGFTKDDLNRVIEESKLKSR